jgi:hypothetical protein
MPPYFWAAFFCDLNIARAHFTYGTQIVRHMLAAPATEMPLNKRKKADFTFFIMLALRLS